MRKPDTCVGCPLYGDGDGFVPDEIVPGSRVAVLLQNPGVEEERRAKPAIGPTGDMLNDSFLPQAGLVRGVDVSVCNSLRCRWIDPATGLKTNKLPTGQVLAGALAQCRQYDRLSGHDVIVAAGGAAWKATSQPGSITEWRGFLGPAAHQGAKVLGVLHPADLFRDPKMRLPSMRDWRKIQHVLAGTYPLPVPPVRQLPYNSGTDEFRDWVDKHHNGPYVVVDTEYDPHTKKLDLLGLAGPRDGVGFQIWWQQIDPMDRRPIIDALLQLFTKSYVVFQNSFADIPILKHNLGIGYHDYKAGIGDTMLEHAVLWSEWPHDLEFLASVYGKYPKMKHLAGINPSLYNWGDVLETISAHEGMEDEFRRDPASRAVYRTQSLELVPVLLKTMERGLKINQTRVRGAIPELQRLRHQAGLMAQAYLGWPVNIGSEKHLKQYLYDTAGYPVQRDKDSKKPSTRADAIASLRRVVGPPYDAEKEDRDGLSLAEALQRIDAGADPILESRVIYAAAQQQLSHYLQPLVRGKVVVDRIYPQFKIHAQASGRWSTTNPPLAQLPSDLRDIVMPDDGDVWIGWDWDQIELRLLAGLANDKPYLEAFANGWDVHTINMCDLFGIRKPHDLTMTSTDPRQLEWILSENYGGKDDVRRVFAKRFVYRLNYGGEPKLAGDIPGASVLGLGKYELVQASQRYLTAHPSMAAWRVQAAADARANGVSRTFMGRRRRLLSGGQAATREAFNHPMQGGVADILNLVTVRIARELPDATLAYTMHDSAWWAVPAHASEESFASIRSIVEDVWDVQGIKIGFPATFKRVSVVNGLPVEEKLKGGVWSK